MKRRTRSPEENKRRRDRRSLMAIPVDATMRGSILSEILPARGEKTVMTIGWAIRMRPAC